MKNLKTIFLNGSMVLSLLGITFMAQAQTAGSLTFNCSTSAPNADYGTKHVLAIWIQDAGGQFVKTNAKYGNEDDHLTSWKASSGGNKVDAVTGATITSYRNESVVWNGTDVNSNVVPDGTYKVFIEMGWGRDKTNDHSVVSFSFTKGTDQVEVTPDGTTNYSNVSLLWEPEVSAIQTQVAKNELLVYPNPSNGLFELEIKKGLTEAKLVVADLSGRVLKQETIAEGFTGIIPLQMTGFKTGIYFVKVIMPQQKLIYKVIKE